MGWDINSLILSIQHFKGRKLLKCHGFIHTTFHQHDTSLFHSDLFAELFLTQLVQGEELLGQDNVLLEATAGQFHTDNDATIWHHHGNSAEVDLQVLWQLLAAGVARVLHGTRTAMVHVQTA